MTRLAIAISLCLLLVRPAAAAPRQPITPRPPTEWRMSLARLAERNALAVEKKGNSISLRHSLATIELAADSRQMRFNGTLVWLNDGLRREGGDWTISVADAVSVLTPLLDPQCAPPVRPPATVLLDPGHGGEDSGAKEPRLPLEKEMNLSIANLTAERLKASDLRVKLTREKDAALTLAARSRAATTSYADVFVSIHINSASNRAVSGIETYLVPTEGFNSTSGRSRDTERTTGNRYDAANQILAYDIQRSVVARTGAPDRGVKRARFDVLSAAPCPAVLVECGFISNTGESASLATPEYRAKVAEGIAQGVLTYLSRCEAQARRNDPILAVTNLVSDPGTVQTGRMDRAAPDTLPDDTER